MSGRFKSYINRYDLEMKEKGQATFKSYINDHLEEDSGGEGGNEEVEKKANNFFDGTLEPEMLKGERVVAHADGVLKFSPFSDRKQGVSGHLFITNFKITFVTADKSSYSMNQPGKRQRHKLLGDHDIPLTKVDSLYQIISGGKRRKLQPGTSISTLTKYLEIHCKDFQIHTYSFKFCPKDQNKTVTNAVVHHSYPTRSDLLFAYDYGHSNKFTDSPTDTRMFYQKQDWEAEITRLGVSTKWRVADVNKEFVMATNLPEYFVVPVYILDRDLIKAAPIYNYYRLPTWCYTHSNGCSVVRMSQVRPESELKEYGKRMLSAVQQACDQSDQPSQVNLTRVCPPIKELQQSYERLKECCMSDSVKDYVSTDLSWYSSLDNTQWLQAVITCLQVAHSVVDNIVQQKQTVIITEESGCDYSCIVSSLVQMCLDPHCRTQVGFQSLIQKEWVAMGHPFQRRHGLTLENEVERAPVFLLFLDCTWQMLQQFPSSFEFTETYLTTLWDSVHLGLCETFLFNNCHQRRKFTIEGRRMTRVNLPSAWNWNTQLTEIDLTLFNNPLYVMREKFNLDRVVAGAKHALSQSGQQLRNEVYRLKLNNMYEEDNVLFVREKGVLLPNFTSPVIKLWKQCYIRWNVPAQIIGGGNPSRYLQQCALVEEVICLQHKLKSLQEDTRQRMFRPQSQLIFSVDEVQRASDLLSKCVLTSSFPFSAGPTRKDYQTLIYTPLNDYIQNSTIDYDYANADE